ncbi:MAG: hypothetical protein H7Y86_11905 [Rhizobacter sp.]|nr:hypothetical protein [Ferruginibacter sp.]
MLYLLSVACSLSVAKTNWENETPESSTMDSITADWKYLYDYRLVATQANPGVMIDNLFSENYAPFSYFKIFPDSSFKWWRTAMETQPASGYGVSGKLTVNNNLRSFKWTEMAETSNDFVSQNPVFPVRYSPDYKIKYLSSDSLVCTYRIVGPDDNYWYWHDVYVK